VDSPDTHELRRLLFHAARQYFAGTPFRRDALIAATLKTGRAFGWWLTELDHSRPHKKGGGKGSAAMVEEAFGDLAHRRVLIQVTEGYWKFAVARLEDVK
jgi:hypothetical protein